MSEKFMTEQVIKYSDGTETVLTYTENPVSDAVEVAVKEATDASEGVVTPEVEESDVESEEDLLDEDAHEAEVPEESAE